MTFNKLKKNEGFTIIEVLIVLAIAGMIMMVVFLAVPALQRNSRNSTRRADVSSMLSKMQETSSNNNGRFVTGTNEPDLLLEGLGFYEGTGTDDWTSVNYGIVASGPATVLPANIDANTVIVRNNFKCNDTGTNAYISNPSTSPIATTAGTANTNIVKPDTASVRNVVIIYAVESSQGRLQLQCLQS